MLFIESFDIGIKISSNTLTGQFKRLISGSLDAFKGIKNRLSIFGDVYIAGCRKCMCLITNRQDLRTPIDRYICQVLIPAFAEYIGSKMYKKAVDY